MKIVPVKHTRIIWLANPMGFCAGVRRAIGLVEHLLDVYGPPIYVRHAIVHNEWVMQQLAARGAIFVESCSEVPIGQSVVFSAHGVGPQVYQAAQARGLKIYDAICPLVNQVHQHIRHIAQSRLELVLIGDPSHVEVQGALGHYRQHSDLAPHVINSILAAQQLVPLHPEALAFATQTTLCISFVQAILQVLRERFPRIQGPKKGDVCYATTNRQQAVHALIRHGIECLLVVSSRHSSNGKKLVQLGEQLQLPTFWIDDPEHMPLPPLEGMQKIGITAAASTPQSMVDALLNRLNASQPHEVRMASAMTHEPTTFSFDNILQQADYSLR